MEVKQLQVFVEICRRNGLSQAAEKMHLSQPAVSQQLGLLERELGKTLMSRDRSGIELTPAGESLLQDSLQIIELEKQARLRASNIQRQKITIAAGGTMAAWVLPRVLKKLRASLPEITFHLVEADEQTLKQILQFQSADLVISDYRPHDGGLISQPLFSDTLRPVTLQGKAGATRLKDVGELNWLFYHEGSAIQHLIESHLERLKLWPIEPAMRLRSLTAMANTVKAGLGIGYLSAEVERRGLVFLKEKKLSISRDFYLIYQSTAAARLTKVADVVSRAI